MKGRPQNMYAAIEETIMFLTLFVRFRKLFGRKTVSGENGNNKKFPPQIKQECSKGKYTQKSSKLMFPIKFMYIRDVTSCWSKGGGGKLVLTALPNTNTNYFSTFANVSSKLTLIVNSRICRIGRDLCDCLVQSSRRSFCLLYSFSKATKLSLRNELAETGTFRKVKWTVSSREAVQNPLQLTACKDVIRIYRGFPPDKGPPRFSLSSKRLEVSFVARESFNKPWSCFGAS